MTGFAVRRPWLNAARACWVLLALLYFGGVIVLQALLGPLLEKSNTPLITVISTLGIAAFFNPLRNRTQDLIDRRFYRKKYDADRALARFAGAARNEVDIDRLASELVELVRETVNPEKVTLWLARLSGSAESFGSTSSGVFERETKKTPQHARRFF